MNLHKLALAAAALGIAAAANAQPAAHGSIDWQQMSAPVNLKMPKASWLSAHMPKHNGVPSFGGGVDRTVQVGAETRWVNVMQDEVVRFVAGDRAFDWRFATHTQTPIDLSQIAPAGFAVGSNPTIFVAPNPLYIGS